MTALDLAVNRLKVEEGFRAKSYRDQRGLLTIGYGFCVDAGITQSAAEALLRAQVQEHIEALEQYPWYAACDSVRQSVLLDISFNVGLLGLLHFVHMLAAINQRNWSQASAQLLDSRAAQENPNRYGVLAKLLLAGESK